MTLRIRSVLAVAVAVAVAACGKSGSKNSDTKVTEGSDGSGGSAGTGGGATGTRPVQAPPRGPEHAVYSLADNRLSAHLVRGGGLYLAAGSTGFAKYVRFGNGLRNTKRTWTLRQTHAEARVAHMTGTSAMVAVPLTAAEIQTPTVRVRAFNDGAAARPFSVRVNDNKDVNGSLAPGPTTVELAIPPGQLKEGENQLLFFVGGGAGLDVQSIQVGGAEAVTDDTAATFWKADSKHLVLPKGGGMTWYVSVPDKAKLTADLPDGACSATVTATGEDGAVVEDKLTGLGDAVDLASLAGKAARVELTADGCASAELANAAIVVPGAAPAAPARGEPPKYVVLFIMDSLRADHVRAFNPDARPEAPTWDKLAESSALFLSTYVQGNESRVSHASIWSSLYPVKHKMIGEKDSLATKWTTVDEVAKSAGKFVAGVSANGYIRPARGFGTAWDKYSNHIGEKLELHAQGVMDHGLKFLDGVKQPWFLYLGVIDTHVSWRAKQPWLDKYDPGYKGRFAEVFGGADAGAAAGGKLQLSPDEIKHVRALYDSNVSYQDDILGKLIEKLTAMGVWDQTLLVVTADHGDEQWEDGRVGHGGSTRDMLIHVPLLVHYPPLVGPGKFTEAAESVDIVPTIADALGVAVDPEWQGQSLIPLSHGVGAGYPNMSFNSMYEDQHAGRIGQWKVRTSSGGYRVYDLAHDPDEMKDIAGQPQAAIGARTVLDALWLMRQLNPEWKKSQWGNAANVSSRFAADLGE